MSYFHAKKGIFTLTIAVISCFSYAQVSRPVSRPLVNEERKTLSDSALLDLVQKQTFKYFWDFAHPVSGLARERSNTTPAYGNEVVTLGGSGFGIMAIIVATERHWIQRDTAVKHLLKSLKFLYKASSYHGIFPHWLNGAT
ncbi:MAG: beta-glucosidase, partial [Bacteroidota bacterium]|nr:beta-glucosidase [Bacteroidota bacterium]